ncbi:MAG: hypothetical protein WD066_07905 [Planctomycetaceae bacterium]
MSDDPAADAPSFRCPACRARQTLRDQCRRCAADLALVARAHRRVKFLIAQRRHARARGEQEREHALAAELRRLAPAAVRPSP